MNFMRIMGELQGNNCEENLRIFLINFEELLENVEKLLTNFEKNFRITENIKRLKLWKNFRSCRKV